MSGRVIIAGAGCGDYDLITMRGYEALKSCDVVIYDSLIDSRLTFARTVRRKYALESVQADTAPRRRR